MIRHTRSGAAWLVEGRQLTDVTSGFPAAALPTSPQST